MASTVMITSATTVTRSAMTSTHTTHVVTPNPSRGSAHGASSPSRARASEKTSA